MPLARRTLVYGPAYLDRVLRVDRPLLDPATGTTLDRSIERIGQEPGSAADPILLADQHGGSIAIEPPPGWPGPTGIVWLAGRLVEQGPGRWTRQVRGVEWLDDLGGMGAGFAAALGGTLRCALGAEDDPLSRRVAALLEGAGIAHRPIRVPDRPADWTLLVTSGAHGDKLAVGFRGCHVALSGLGESAGDAEEDLVVVAGLPNRLAAEALGRHPSAVRLLAPAMRTMLDRDPPLASLAGSIDILSCNRREWEALRDGERLASGLSVLAITDGPAGSRIHYRAAPGVAELAVPALPRDTPPRDTNRAGEAYAATLVTTLLDGGWRPPEPVPDALVCRAAERASAAAALVLDRETFGFPTTGEIEATLRLGRVTHREIGGRG